MQGLFVQQRRNNEQEIEKTPFLVAQKIRDAIFDETFKPGERLPESGLGKIFKVSRSHVREALFALVPGRESPLQLTALGITVAQGLGGKEFNQKLGHDG
jgi:Bacterial regulatory proteins, gntR family